MPASLGSAQYELTVNGQGLVSGLKQAETQAQASSSKIAQSLGQVEKSATMTAGAFRSLGATAATLAGFGGIASGALVLHEAMLKVAESTLAAERAQFALNKTYGVAAVQYTAFAKAQAAATGQTTVAFQQSAVMAGTLSKNYGFTSEQIQILIKRSADLAAIHGKEVPDAFERVQAAMRGEGEAAEALGLTLNSDAVKAMGAMTDAQRQNFETLGQVTKAQIIYTEFLRQTAHAEGAASEGAKTHIGQISLLSTRFTEAAAALGQTFLPAVGKMAEVLNTGAGELTKMFEALGKVAEQRSEVEQTFAAEGQAILGMMGPVGNAINSVLNLQKTLQDFGVLSKGVAKSVADDAAAAAADAADKQIAAQRQVAEAQKAYDEQAKKALKEVVQATVDEANARLEASRASFAAASKALDESKQKDIEATKNAADAQVKEIERVRDAAVKAGEAEVKRLEYERDAKIKAIEDQVDAVNKGLKAEIDGIKAATDQAITEYERQRDGKIRAVNEQAEAASRAVDAEVRERSHARTEEDRNLQDTTQATKRAIDARHTAAVRGFEAEAKAANAAKDQVIRGLDAQAKAVRASAAEQIKGLEAQATKAQAAHDARIRSIEKQLQKAQQAHDKAIRNIQDQEKAAEDAHNRTLRNIEATAQVAERAHDEAMRGIEEQKRAEDNRHRIARDNLAAELRQRTAAIDQQISALDALDRAEQQSEARQRLQDQLAGAQSGLKRAESTGNLSEIEAARRAVADIERQIQQQSVQNTRDAERDKLHAAQDAIRDEISARQTAEDEQNRVREEALAADKQAADDRLALVKAGLDVDKQAADDRLAAIKEGLDKASQAADDNLKKAQDRAAKQKQAADDSLKSTLARIATQKAAVQEQAAAELESIAQQKQAAEDANKATLEDIAGRKQAEADAHDAEIIAAQDVAEAAQRAIQDRRTAEDEATADRRQQIADEKEVALEAIRAEYDDAATGKIPAAKRAEEAAIAERQARITANTEAAAAAVEATRNEYDGPDGKITKSKAAIAAAQEEARGKIEAVRQHEKDALAAIKERYDEAQRLLDESQQKEKAALEASIKSYQDMTRESITELQKLQTAWENLTRAIEAAQQAASGGAKPGPIYGPPNPDATPKNPGNPGSSDNGAGPKLPYNNSEVTGPAGYRASNSGGFRNNEERIAFVRAEAIRRGHDPDVAERVARSEGAGPLGPVGDSGRSFGALQANTAGGQGNTFQNETGLDPSDPNNEKALISWQLDNLSKTGWEPFHGAKAVGVGDRQGINVASPREPAPTSQNMVTYRDEWGNEYTVTESQFQQRQQVANGTNPVTVVPNAVGNATKMSLPAGGMANFGQSQQIGNQFELGLPYDQALAACGPAAVALFVEATGRTPNREEVMRISARNGWSANAGMGGFGAFQKTISDLGINAAVIPTSLAGASAASGSLTAISTGGGAGHPLDAGHYFVAQGYDPSTGKFDLGETGGPDPTNPQAAHALKGGSRFMTLAEIEALAGPINGVLQLLDQADTAILKFGDGVGTVTAQTTDAFGTITTSVTDAMGAVTTTVTDAAGNITDQFTTVTTEVPAAVEGMTGAVETSVTDLGDTIQTSITDSAGNITTTFTDLSGNVIDQVTTMADGTVVAMTDLAEGTTTQTTALADGVETVVTDLSGNVVTTFTDLAGQVVGQSVAMADGTITNTGAMAEGVTTTVTDMSGTVTETFTDLLGNVTETTTDLQGTVTKTFTDASGTVTKTVTDLNGTVTKTVTDMSGKVISTTQTMAKDTGAAFKSIEKPAQSAVTEMEAVGEVEIDAPDVSDVISSMKKIEDAAKKARSALKDVDKGGSGSGGSKEFAKKAGGGPVRGLTPYIIGENGPELFVPGSDGYILDNAKTGAALNPSRMLGALPAAMTMVGGGASGASVGGGNVVIDLRGAQVYDGQRFENRLVSALSTADRRGRLRFLRGDG